jgi:hypothetical protein
MGKNNSNGVGIIMKYWKPLIVLCTCVSLFTIYQFRVQAVEKIAEANYAEIREMSKSFSALQSEVKSELTNIKETQIYQRALLEKILLLLNKNDG